jgi:dTDP-4-dehydrorhamnose 3,5-epimerase
MKVTPLQIPGAWLISSVRFADQRGWFQEWFKHTDIESLTGLKIQPQQANLSHSRAGVIRGIHYSLAEEGQVKVITVLQGKIEDFTVDLNPTSPTFLQWNRVCLDSRNGETLVLAPFTGHAFQSLEDNTLVCYLVSAEYDPESEFAISPFDTEINLPWDNSVKSIVSERDRNAPTLREQQIAGHLPT